jgi:hypothetical protein
MRVRAPAGSTGRWVPIEYIEVAGRRSANNQRCVADRQVAPACGGTQQFDAVELIVVSPSGVGTRRARRVKGGRPGGGTVGLVDHQRTAAGEVEIVGTPPDDDDRGVVRGADEGCSDSRLHLLSSYRVAFELPTTGTRPMVP